MKNTTDTETIKPVTNQVEIDLPKAGQTIEGKIIGSSRYAVYIDLEAIGTGIIFGKEYYAAKDILRKLNSGDEIKAKIIAIDQEEGFIELSLRDAQKEGSWDSLKDSESAKETVTITIEGANKGGLLAEYQRIKGFLPLSQLSIANYPRVKDGDAAEILKHLQELVGKTLQVKIIDVSSQENKLIFSEKAVTSKEVNDLLDNYKVADIVKGKITGIANFGAFIKFPVNEDGAEQGLQAEGLIHISELDWQLIDSVSEVVKVGDIVEAKVSDISKDGRVSLSLKALKEDPWKDIETKFKKGDIVDGTVAKINQLGAFIEISPKIRGLVHLSELQNPDSLKKDNKYQFEITALDPDNHRMGLKPNL